MKISKYYLVPLYITAVAIMVTTITPTYAATYYVSTTGNDANSGTSSQPFRTFNYANSKLVAGDTLYVNGGTYNQKLVISKSGTSSARITILPVSGQTPVIDVNTTENTPIHIIGNYISISGFTAREGSSICELIEGDYVTSSNMIITGCLDHGTMFDGDHDVIETHTVYDTNLNNIDRVATNSWGSGIKVGQGATNGIIRNNTVYNNYGEGIASTMGANITISDNVAYDNFGVNIYIDNSHDVVVERNLVTCTGNPNFMRDGDRPVGIAYGMEVYSGWGEQFYNVTVRNNAVAYCHFGISFWGSDVATGGLDRVTMYNNTFWGSTAAAVYFEPSAYTVSSVFANNIIQKGTGILSWVPSAAGISFHHNYWVNELPEASVRGTGDLSGDVKLVTTPTYNDRNTFRLQSTSPAIDKGSTISSVVNDTFNQLRPYGSAYDMGAHEYRPDSVYLPTTLKNMYTTFGKILYGKTYSSSVLRNGDTMYFKNYDPKKIRIICLFLYDYTLKRNQGYTASRVTTSSRFLRTNYLIPSGRQYAYVVKIQDIATGISTTKYFVFKTQ